MTFSKFVFTPLLQQMHKLSVVIITLNEEKNIERCLLSVREIADEVVVVDSFSTDATKEICEKFGVRFIEHEFQGYVEQKNFAALQASHDLVLSLDADEVPDNKLIESISSIKVNWEFDGYYIKRLNNYCGTWIRHGAWYPNRKLRLWNRKKGRWIGFNPHDHFELTAGSTAGYLEGDLLHYSYDSIEAHVAQFNKFTTLSAIEMHNAGKKGTLFKIYFSPLVNFMKGFFLRLGFLDGYYGIMICLFNPFATYLKYLKLRQLNKGLKL